MATVCINVDEYFATISPLAKKISQDLDNVKESYGDDWNDFSCDQQDKELWKNLVPSEITDKYASQSSDEELRSVFPKLKIPCGEKIVVDFDNDDGWTWTDEHSGPFSWRSRSQQDLSLFDDEPEREMQKARNLKKTKHSKPPVTQTNQSQAFVEKNNWSSHFLASEKSTSHNVDPDTLEIFQRFGITFGGKEEEDVSDALSIQVADEESSLLAGETDRDGLQLKLDTELLVDTDPSISEDTSEGTPDTIVVDTDMLVTSTVDSKPVSPTDAACYSRDMQSYQTYFTDAYNESSHQTAVTEQPKPVLRPPSPVTDTAVKHPRHVPASPVTAVTQPKPASPVTTVTQPKPASPVTTVTPPKPVPKPPSPVTQPKPVPKLEPVDPVKQPSDTSNTLSDADTSYASKKSGFDFLDNW